MSSEIAISVKNVSKAYTIWRDPTARVKHPLLDLVGEMIPPLRKKVDEHLKGLSSEFYALKDISFEVKKGESVGIIGRNGSGKSTLLQIIAGTLQPSEGSVTVNGRVAALLELGSGFNPEFTGRQNVYLNASILGLTRKETEERFAEIEAFADIGKFIDQPVKTYSSGMVVRLAFAVIAHVNADVLIIDEALAVGDAFFVQKCMRFIRNFIREHTLFFVSHDTGAVKNVCQKAILLEKGVVVQIGTPKKVTESYLKSFYEAQQGESKIKKTINDFSKSYKKELPLPRDSRLDWVNKTNLRNDIQIISLKEEMPCFGKGGALIKQVELLDDQGLPLSWVIGGESVMLRVIVECKEKLEAPIVGFHIKDHLGQLLFGDNTYLSYYENPQACFAEEEIAAQFSFQMPRLAKGNYFVEAAIANGTQEEHVQHHWVHEALLLRSESTSVSSGIIGIGMEKISLVKNK